MLDMRLRWRSVLLITLSIAHAPFNATTVAFTYLLAILGGFIRLGSSVPYYMSLAATLTLQLLFSAPSAHSIVADPQKLGGAGYVIWRHPVLASDSRRARAIRAAEANRRRREFGSAVSISQRLLSAEIHRMLMRFRPHRGDVRGGSRRIVLADKQRYTTRDQLPQLDGRLP